MAATEIDPVCGMTVDPEKNPDLHHRHEDKDYWFCGKGCLLELKDSPETYTNPDYKPMGM